MIRNATKITLALIILLLVGVVGYLTTIQIKNDNTADTQKSVKKEVAEVPAYDDLDPIESKKARQDYFFRLLRNPATNKIPDKIRQRELKHAKSIPTRLELKRRLKSANPSMQVAEGFNWRLAGPPAVGGRTRALGIDQRNPDIIIAGGVSGGIWKSTDGGENWTLRTPNVDNFSVTSLTQDPTNPDTWYYVAGEFIGNTASAPGAFYTGTGVFQSTDNGDSWNRLNSTADLNTPFNSQFDYMNKIVVNPVTGSVFFSSNGFGVYRSTDGENFSNEPVIGTEANQVYSTVEVAPSGRLVAVISQASFDQGNQTHEPGVYVSDDDGQSWTDVTPSTFPSQYARSVAAIAPSNSDIIYILTEKTGDDSNQGVSFHMIDLSGGLNNPTAEDRSANLPDFGEPVGGMNLQSGYNMTVSVKPNDPNLVTVGGINLFRSFDGFATAPDGNTEAEKNEFWIGGYAKENNVSQYPNQHADQHTQVYDPTDPNRLWVGHDGGVSVTNDVTASSVSWTSRDDGYIVTQFYDASIGLEADDPRFMGGSQDNGTPFFDFRDEQDIGNTSANISSGDGGFSFFTKDFIFVSNQRGNSGNNRVIRFDRDLNNFAIVQPSQAQTALFINPYMVVQKTNDQTIMYYPATSNNLSTIFRNNQVDEISNTNNDGTEQGWEELSATELPTNYIISALEVTTIPPDILYYAGSSDAEAPIIKRLENASTSNQEPADISIPNAPAGAWVHDIAVNPADGNDVLAVMSNYNITGLYHTSNGGQSWQAVEGNLTGSNLQGALNFGPSLRSATIIPSTSGPIYMLGTSTGVYATQNLDGNNTQWGRESPFSNDGNTDIGFSVVENITSRFTDGDVAVGTHGRGMFVGRFQGETEVSNIPRISLDPEEARAGEQVTIEAINFQFNSDISGEDVLFGDVPVREIVNIEPDQITVIVPRAILEPQADDRSVRVSVLRESGTDPVPVTFTVLPPSENALDQNFPNPFSSGDSGTNIPISLQMNSNVTLQIYDISGRLVDEILKGDRFNAGTYNIPVDFSGKASGIYIYRLIANPVASGNTFIDSGKFTFIK